MEPGAGRAALAAKQLVVSGAGRGAMKSGLIAANLVTIIKSVLCVFQPFCVTGIFIAGCEKRNGWLTGRRPQIQMRFRREKHLEKKTVVVSMLRRDKTKICVFGLAK